MKTIYFSKNFVLLTIYKNKLKQDIILRGGGFILTKYFKCFIKINSSFKRTFNNIQSSNFQLVINSEGEHPTERSQRFNASETIEVAIILTSE